MHSGTDDFARAEVPFVMFVTILALGADVGDFIADTRGSVEGLTIEPIAARATSAGFGPHGTRDEFEQLGLAGAVAADEQPALPRPYAPGNIAQHCALAAIEIDAAERDGNGQCGAGARHASARAYLRKRPS